MEPHFDANLDALWKLELTDGHVEIERDDWHKRGDVSRWLTSDVFHLQSTAALSTERLLARAAKLLDTQQPRLADVQAVDAELGRALPAMDPFFVRWRYYMKPLLERAEP